MQLKAVILQCEVLRHAVYVCDGDCVLRPLKVGGLLPFRNAVNVLIRLLQVAREQLDPEGTRTKASRPDSKAKLFCKNTHQSTGGRDCKE